MSVYLDHPELSKCRENDREFMLKVKFWEKDWGFPYSVIDTDCPATYNGVLCIGFVFKILLILFLST